MLTPIQKAFAPLKRTLPAPISNIIRSTVTATLTPTLEFYKSGHFRSSFAMKAMDRFGNPLPWYTYPCIEFLKRRNFADRTVLEFGAGQSTLWWATKAKHVVALEGNKEWMEKLHPIPPNVTLRHIANQSGEACVSECKAFIDNFQDVAFDIVIIDGLERSRLIPLVLKYLSKDGAIIFDNSDGYGFYEAIQSMDLQKLDFFGSVPGVILPQSTSILFREGCFLFDRKWPMKG